MAFVDPYEAESQGFVDPYEAQVPENDIPQPIAQPESIEAGQPQPIAQAEPAPFSIDDEKKQLIASEYLSGTMSPRRKEAVEELQKRGKLTFGDALKMADMSTLGVVGAVAEPIKTMVTGYGADIASGFAALRTLLETGDLNQANKVVKQMQEQFTAMPESPKGKQALGIMGDVMKPVADIAGEGMKAVGEFAESTGIPYAEPITQTALRMIPEVLGLKITKAAKIKALNKTIGGKIEGLYDELGKIHPEIQKGLDEAGISVDELKSVMPEAPRREEILKTAADEIGGAAGDRFGKEKKMAGVAEDAMPNKEIIDAIDEMGIKSEFLMSHVSENPIARSLEQGLKKIPGSQLAPKEAGFIKELGEKADDLIVEFGGQKDKSLLSDMYKAKSLDIIDGLDTVAGDLYDKLNKNLPGNFSVKADNMITAIEKEIKKLGGIEHLGKKEAELYNGLKSGSNPTYARLDKYRKEIGQAMKKRTGPFRHAGDSELKYLYKNLAKDQHAFAESQGWGDVYKTANEIYSTSKGIESQLVKTLGEGLTGTIASKGRSAVMGLQKGETKLFDDLVKNIPDAVGKDMRRSIFATSLNDAFVGGSRKYRSLNVPAFDDFMVGINRHPNAKARLTKEIGKPAIKRLETFHKIVGGVRRALGEVGEVPRIFDTSDNIASKLYGVGKAFSFAKGAALGVVETAINAKRTPRSVAADALLSNSKFQEMIKKKASKALDTNEKIKRADEIVQNLKEYKKWANTVPPRDLKDVATVGVIGYLTGKQDKENK